MSIKFDVVYKDGFKITATSICFGVLEKHRWGEMSAYQVMDKENHGSKDQRYIQFHTNYQIHNMWYEETGYKSNPKHNSDPNGHNVCSLNFIKEMKELQKDMPMLQGLVTFHPRLHVARIHIKNHTVDEIMLALFLVRNLCKMSSSCYGYRYLREVYNLRPRLAAILAHQFSVDFGFNGTKYHYPHFLSEYNWIDPQTFGKNSLIRLMSHTKDTKFDYRQGLWKDDAGYNRDSYFFNKRIEFFGDIDQNKLNRDQWKFWKMCSPLSLPNDEPISHHQILKDSIGFYLKDPSGSSDGRMSSDFVDDYIKTVIELLSENNIKATL